MRTDLREHPATTAEGLAANKRVALAVRLSTSATHTGEFMGTLEQLKPKA